jgi:peroxiredoxin
LAGIKSTTWKTHLPAKTENRSPDPTAPAYDPTTGFAPETTIPTIPTLTNQTKREKLIANIGVSIDTKEGTMFFSDYASFRRWHFAAAASTVLLLSACITLAGCSPASSNGTNTTAGVGHSSSSSANVPRAQGENGFAANNLNVGGASQPKVEVPVVEAPQPVLHKPEVVLSEAYAKTCLVKAGDAMPPLMLTDLDGNPQSLDALRGEKLTVVVFWTQGKIYAREQFTRLGFDVLDQYSGLGVGLVAVNVGDSAEDVKKLYDEQGREFPCLLDPAGAAFATVATEKLPRTYVLDPDGKILWFDIGYSQTTERELNNAVHYFLKPPPAN